MATLITILKALVTFGGIFTRIADWWKQRERDRLIVDADRAKGHELDADLQRQYADQALNRPDADAVDQRLRDGEF